MSIAAAQPPTTPHPFEADECDASRNTQCPACNRLPSVLKCNAHRTESISAGVIRKAKAAGYKGSNPLEAEKFIGALPVQIG